MELYATVFRIQNLDIACLFVLHREKPLDISLQGDGLGARLEALDGHTIGIAQKLRKVPLNALTKNGGQDATGGDAVRQEAEQRVSTAGSAAVHLAHNGESDAQTLGEFADLLVRAALLEKLVARECNDLQPLLRIA